MVFSDVDAELNSKGQLAPAQPGRSSPYPCVFYECNSSFEISYVSPNVSELIRLRDASILGSRAFYNDRVFSDDIEAVNVQLTGLKGAETAFLVHRIVDELGACRWVAHSLRHSGDLLQGCLVPISHDIKSLNLDLGVVSRFIHKIGNHFQLLTLLISPLKKTLSKSKEIEVLEETVEKAISIARALADYSQRPNWSATMSLDEVITGAMSVRAFMFVEAGIRLRNDIEDSVKGITIPGDAALLESAIGNIVENALEATESDGEVSIHAKLENLTVNNSTSSIITLRITDTGCGVAPEDLNKIMMPFYTTKQNHDGLGLSMASRFIELHGGGIRVDSSLGHGTEVQITIPVTATK